MRGTFALLILLVPAAAAIAALEPFGQPTFRARTDVVQAEAIVVDPEGRQFAHLTSTDFSLSVDGQARAIESVDYIATESDVVLPGKGLAQVRPSTDRGTAARHVVFVVDEGSIGAGHGRAAFSALARMLDRFGPMDRLAVLSIPSGPSVDFTNDREPIRTALNRAIGRASRMNAAADFNLSLTDLFAFDTGASSSDRANQESVRSRACPPAMPEGPRELCLQSLDAEAQSRLDAIHERTRNTTSALDRLVQSLATMAGPKVVVLVSEGLIMRPDHRDEGLMTSLGSRAALADVKIFVILLDGSFTDITNAGGRMPSASASSDRSIEEDALRALTATSGGSIQRASAAPERTVERLANALSGYYLIGFRVSPDDKEGPHQIKIAVGNSSLNVIARTVFAVTPGDRRPANTATERSSRASRGRAAFSSLSLDKTKLFLATRSVADTDGTVRILLSVDVNDTAAHPITALALGYKLVSGDRVVAETGRVVPVAHGDDGRAQPVSYFAFRNVPPGRYKLELSASDGSKHSGFATHSVDAMLHAFGAYRLGDILVASSAPNQDGPFPVPANVVVSSRTVTGVEVTAATLEDLESVSVRFEVVGTARAVDAPGRTIKLQSGGPLSQFVRTTLELPSVPNGEYLLRASLIVGGSSVGDIDTSFRLAR